MKFLKAFLLFPITAGVFVIESVCELFGADKIEEDRGENGKFKI